MTELELKFIVPAACLDSLRQDLLGRGALAVRMRAHYFDTADMALARHRAALRLRLEGRHWVQTLKAAGAGAVHRLEHEVRVPGRPSERPALDPARHAGSPAAAGLAAALADAADPALTELHATEVLRLQLQLQDAEGTQIEAALDTGHAHAAGRQDALQELELEHKGGPLAGLFELAIACVRHGGLWQSTLTKAERGLRLHLGQTGLRAAPHRPAQAAAAAPPAAVLRACLQAVLTPLLAHSSELAGRAPATAGAPTVPGFDAVAAALGADLSRLGALLRCLQDDRSPEVAGWQAQARALQGLARAHRHHPDALGATARSTGLQVLLLQLQQRAHAGDDAFAAASALPPATWRRRRAALVKAGLLLG
ncbi:CYTH domain-containing protein [Rubrivivax rivuli]|uniref:CYTH domain-containing protein n=1 Tax=Rubrivivax rivuli TaxID=1862385 RepID=A0A437RH50_9BURK|nr:CYTH domain-containing protein [Rubrivivax rivuli]RVU46093.1 CYTH domain-containing protein [Rubrivivax rivuli]